MLSESDPADFAFEFEQQVRASPTARVADWAERWPHDSSRSEMVNSLLTGGMEVTGYDFGWLRSQLEDERIAGQINDVAGLLRTVYEDQIGAGGQPRWVDYADFGSSASELMLRVDHDPCCLGELLGDRYQLTRRIGSGGLGAVFEGRLIPTNEPVAIKVPRVGGVQSEVFAERLRDEAGVLQSLDCPGAPRFIEFCDYGDFPWLVTNLIEGAPLEARIVAGGSPIAEALTVIQRVANILDRVHQHGVVHGDVKGENVLVDGDGTVTLIDFNVSRRDEVEGVLAELPGGTRPFMSPEAHLGAGADVDLRQDVFALGALLYQLISGERLIPGNSKEDALVQSILAGSPAETHLLRFDEAVPRSVRSLISAMIARQAVDRFETTGDIAEACAAVRQNINSEFVFPPMRAELQAWRLGVSLGRMMARQRRVTTGLSDASQIESAQQKLPLIHDSLAYAVGVTTSMDEVCPLADRLGARLSPWEGAEQYRIWFYRMKKLTIDDLPEMASLAEAGEAWCRDAFQGIEAYLTASRPVCAAYFLSAVQAQFAPYSSDARSRWLTTRDLLPCPPAVTEGFAAMCASEDSGEKWGNASAKLDCGVVRWLRWGRVEIQEETDGTAGQTVSKKNRRG